MAWMAGHGGHGATAGHRAPTSMPGMASEDELKRLSDAKGKDAEILFLQLMIRHHEGGVQMAQGLLRLSDRDEVATMASTSSTGRQARSVDDRHVGQRGAQRLPSIL